MGMGTEAMIVNQLKKAQGETNQRLDHLIATQQHTNELRAWLTTAITERLSPTN
jgi:tRNA A22 N-methylase